MIDLVSTLVATLRQPLAILDHSLSVMQVNPAFCEAFSVEANELAGRPLAGPGRILGPAPALQSLLERVANGAAEADEAEIALVLPSGLTEIVPCLARRSNAAGEPVVVLVLDIRETEGAHDRLRRRNAILESEAADRAVQLEASNRELRAVNRELEAFCYSISHDLHAPLRAVDGFSQALLDDYGDRFDDAGRHYLNRVRAGVQRMGRLIDDLQVLSRLTRSEMHWKRVNLSEIVAELLADRQQHEPAREAELRIEPELYAECDPRLMRIALENLVGNAWKFTSRKPRTVIEFGANGASESRQFYLRDNGAGFDNRLAGRLYGPFQRLHTDDEFPGTGIGLAIVWRVISRHGGRTWAEGEVDRGATFFFTLPALGERHVGKQNLAGGRQS